MCIAAAAAAVVEGGGGHDAGERERWLCGGLEEAGRDPGLGGGGEEVDGGHGFGGRRCAGQEAGVLRPRGSPASVSAADFGWGWSGGRGGRRGRIS